MGAKERQIQIKNIRRTFGDQIPGRGPGRWSIPRRIRAEQTEAALRPQAKLVTGRERVLRTPLGEIRVDMPPDKLRELQTALGEIRLPGSGTQESQRF